MSAGLSDASNWYEFTYACYRGDIQRMEYLIQRGSAYWDDGLRYACHTDKTNVVERLLKEHISRLTLTQCSYYACKNLYLNTIKCLINNNKFDKSCTNTGLYEACKINDANIIKFMLDIGADDVHCMHESQICDMLNIGIGLDVFKQHATFSKIIQRKHDVTMQFLKDADDILLDLYKKTQNYDKNILNIVVEYIMYDATYGEYTI